MRRVSETVILAIHARLVGEHGGNPGLRDLALAKPENILAYTESSDIASLAAAYAYGIATNPPFVTGNAGTALVVMRTYLRLNGFDLVAPREEKYRIFRRLSDGEFSEDEMAGWIGEHIERQ